MHRAVSEWMTKPVITTRVDASVLDAATELWTHHIRHLPVVDDDGRVQGLLDDAAAFGEGAFSGTPDALSWVWFNHAASERTTADLMLPVEVSAAPAEPLVNLLHRWVQSGRDAALVLSDGRAVGIFTEHDIVRIATERLGTSIPIEPTGEALTVEATVNPIDALYVMGAQGVRHLVVTEDGQPIKVVSYRDLVASRATGHDRVGQVASKGPLHTIESDAALVFAGRKMHEEHIGCLPVMHEGTLVGVVTRRDLLFALAQSEAE